MNGETGEDERSVEIAISESIAPESLEGSIDQFTVFVNGEEKDITSISFNETKDSSIILNLDEFLVNGDEIKVSYTGTSIKSKSNKKLNTFSDLVINNVTKKRAIIPVRIEVEDYDFMIGLVEEETQDEGGGLNFGYTDAGDYADYSIFVPESGTYGIKFRVAGFDEGKIGLYSVDESGEETELVIVTTAITDGWQTWETFASNLFIEEGPHTLRMRILSGGFNFNWLEFGYPDTDGDGVLDDVDECPDTAENTAVDIKGCPVFTMPMDNYSFLITSETCRSQNNGSISLSAVQDYDYTVSLSGEGNSVYKTFNSEVEFDNLSAGTYTVCITISEYPNYEQCFTAVVTEPDELVVTSNVDASASRLELSLTGSDVYYVSVNDKTIITSERQIELPLTEGVNKVNVKTNIDCQGIYEEVILNTVRPIVSPNPLINDKLYITPGQNQDISGIVEIYYLSGKLIFSKEYATPANPLEVDVSSIPTGVFILKIVTSEETFNYKIIK